MKSAYYHLPVLKLVKPLILLGLIVGLYVFMSQSVLAAASITETLDTANLSPANNQSAATVITTANVSEVLSSLTIRVTSTPTTTEDITVGNCVITFTAVAGSTSDETNCNNNNATIDLDTGVGNVARTVAQLAAVIATITNLTDPIHDDLDVATTSNAQQVRFTVADFASSTALIDFTDGTSGNVLVVATTSGVIAVAQVNTLTITGTVETGDRHIANLPGSVTVTYTVQAGDSTTSHIANGLRTAILASAGYGAQAFTAATSTNTIVFTAKTAGTGFTQTSSATNRSAVAQVVEFAPINVDSSRLRFTIVIDSTSYQYTSSNASLKEVVEGLVSALGANTAVTCTENDVEVTCTADVAGTAFTYSSNVAVVSASGGGGGGGSIKKTVPVMNDSDDESEMQTDEDTPSSTVDLSKLREQVRQLIAVLTSQGKTVPEVLVAFAAGEDTPTQVRDLTVGMKGDDVMKLQEILIAAASGEKATALKTTGASGYFGTMTQAALAEYQVAMGITPSQGYFGAKTRAAMKAKMVIGIWW